MGWTQEVLDEVYVALGDGIAVQDSDAIAWMDAYERCCELRKAVDKRECFERLRHSVKRAWLTHERKHLVDEE